MYDNGKVNQYFAMVPPFQRGQHHRQSKAIVKEGMGPQRLNGKRSAMAYVKARSKAT